MKTRWSSFTADKLSTVNNTHTQIFAKPFQMNAGKNMWLLQGIYIFATLFSASSGKSWWGDKGRRNYAGLVNQGETCYLNALLQILFFTKEFREGVYSADAGYHNDLFIEELSNLFRQLEDAASSVNTGPPQPVSTVNLTSVIKWPKWFKYNQAQDAGVRFCY